MFRAVAAKKEFSAQWEEDVDSLRGELREERKKGESKQAKLAGVIYDLEEELENLQVKYTYLVHMYHVLFLTG